VVQSERGQTEGSIGTVKSQSYKFNHRTERNFQTLTAIGQAAMVSLNLNRLMKDVLAAQNNAQSVLA
jgi:hypothetical protein